MPASVVRDIAHGWSAALARFAGWPRRLVALGLLVAAALSATGSSSRGDPPPATRAVLVAATDLRAGITVDRASVQTVRLPVGLVPAGAVHSLAGVVGRTLGAPLRRGEPLTDIRLVGPALAASLAGRDAVAVPVRLSDADTAALLRPGDHLDVLAAPQRGDTGAARVVARDARVMAIPSRSLSTVDTADGSLVVLATSEKAAQTLAAAATSDQITVTLRPNR